MSVERNKAVVSRLYDEVINLEMPSVINMIFAQDVVIHDPFRGTVLRGVRCAAFIIC